MQFLDFEQPIIELEAKIRDLSLLDDKNKEIFSLKKDINSFLEKTYEKLTPWQITQVARHPNRPHASHYINAFIKDFQVLSGDRSYSEDKAIISGIGYFNDESVIVIGQEKGSDTESRLKHNFGMARPEGYRKALRIMKLAEKFNKPIITLIDTPGAYPGLEAEERGQAEAIAKNIQEMATLKVPVICIVIGEGASGGALGIGVGDKVYMMEYTWYSVISPESCSSILWRSWDYKEQAAEALKLTSKDLKKMGIIDGIIKEPLGGAHNDVDLAAKRIKKVILNDIADLGKLNPEKRIDRRIDKFSNMGVIND